MVFDEIHDDAFADEQLVRVVPCILFIPAVPPGSTCNHLQYCGGAAPAAAPTRCGRSRRHRSDPNLKHHKQATPGPIGILCTPNTVSNVTNIAPCGPRTSRVVAQLLSLPFYHYRASHHPILTCCCASPSPRHGTTNQHTSGHPRPPHPHCQPLLSL